MDAIEIMLGFMGFVASMQIFILQEIISLEKRLDRLEARIRSEGCEEWT